MKCAVSKNDQKNTPALWVQSKEGEWLYAYEKSNTYSSEDEYIWLVSNNLAESKVAGYRINNKQIETVVEELAGVNQAVAFGVPHEQCGNAIHIYVAANSDKINADTLKNAVMAKITGYFGEFVEPESVTLLESLPATNNKKISRQILKSKKITMSYVA